MKKSMILLGMLSIGYAYAQSTDPYEGKVGINTDQPSATLNVKSLKGTTSSTKNFELQNANGRSLLIVLDNGYIGNIKNPETNLDIIGRYNENAEIRLTRYGDNTVGANMVLGKAKGDYQSPQIPDVGSTLGQYRVSTYTGSRWDAHSSNIATLSAGAPADNGNMPTNMVINVTSLDGARNPLLQVRGNDVNTNISGVGIGLTIRDQITEKLDVNGNARVRNLPTNIGTTTDKIVVVDDTGVLKSVDRSTITSSEVKATATEATCSDANAGTFHYKEREVNGQQVGTMGFCTRQNGNYIWVYFSNGASILQSAGTNKFGEGL